MFATTLAWTGATAVGRQDAARIVVEAADEVRLEARHHLPIGVSDPVHPADALELLRAGVDEPADGRHADEQVRDAAGRSRSGRMRRRQALGADEEADDDRATPTRNVRNMPARLKASL